MKFLFVLTLLCMLAWVGFAAADSGSAPDAFMRMKREDDITDEEADKAVEELLEELEKEP